MQFELHPGAFAGDWYEGQLPGLGADFADEVDRALEAVGERPTTWPLWPSVGEALGVRRFLLTRFPFALGYLVEGDKVIVLAVAHLRRRPGYWVERAAGGR